LADAGREGVMARPARLNLTRPFLTAYPNPMRSGLVVEYNLTSPALVRLRVFDAAGRTVRHLVDAPRLNGLHRIRWDGCDSRGQVLAGGIYFVELKSGDIRLTEKLVIQR
ncbi:MAG: FlgD immunoglobulin-like domain containing protein, partial [candidate division WOR-3 bacterium]